MKNNRITDDEAAALFRGRTPHARDELSPLAATFAGFRASSFGTPPRPSAAVASRLDLERVASGATPRDGFGTTAHLPSVVSVVPGAASSGKAGLGLAARIAIGSAVVVALGATGAGAAGAAGVLPAPAQEVFEQVTHVDPGPSDAGLAGVDDAGSGHEANDAPPDTDDKTGQSATSDSDDARGDQPPLHSGEPSGEPGARGDQDADGDAGAEGTQGRDTGADVPSGRPGAGPTTGRGTGEDQDQSRDRSEDEQGSGKDVAGD